MKTRITEKLLARFYRLLDTPMLDFDCGTLCTSAANAIPHCCDSDAEVPVLFEDEFRWQRKRDHFWGRMQVRTAEDRALVDNSMEHYVFAACPGAPNCKRSRRAIVCRVYPFEPHLDRQGRVVGLAFQNERDQGCPLTSCCPDIFRRPYIANSIQFWRGLLDLFPKERDLYASESRNRIRRAKRCRRRLPVLRESGDAVSVLRCG